MDMMDMLGEDMVRKITKCSRLHSALGVVKKTKLIESVKKRRCVWDHRHEDFKSATARANAFNEIIAELSDYENQYTRTQMQEEWGKIRYCFTRIIKKQLVTNDDEDAISWPHWEDMQFMYDHIIEHLESHKDKTAEKEKQRFKSSAPSPTMVNASPATAAATACLSPRNPRKRRQSRFTDLTADLSVEAASTLYHLALKNELMDGCVDARASPSSGSSSASPQPTQVLDRDGTASESILASLIKGEGGINVDDSRAFSDDAHNSIVSNWDSFIGTMNIRNDPLNALVSQLGGGEDCGGLPTTSSATTTILLPPTVTNSTPVNMPTSTMTSGELFANGVELRSNLPSIESSESNGKNGGGDSSRDNLANETDPSEFFGKYMIQQMKSVSKRNPTLGVLLRKELMEVCCKYELQSFSRYFDIMAPLRESA